MDYQSAIQYLDSFTNFELKLGGLEKDDFTLDDFQKLLSLIGYPQNDFKIVHIAGTKGKGSTAALTAQMLKSAGYRVGLYTSPHLYDVRERIRILSNDGKTSSTELFHDSISCHDFVTLVDELKKIITERFKGKLTYFEFLTALAFVYFQRKRVNIVVLETGLGGRLDATNVVKPVVCAITRIGLEHTNILGNTIEEIAAEKAGIIKPGCLGVVSGPQSSEAQEVIRNVCDDRGVVVDFVDGEKGVGEMALLGDFQQENAAVASAIIDLLSKAGFVVSSKDKEDAAKEVVWPARMELLSRNPMFLIDGAHTKDSCRRLVQNFKRYFFGCRMVLILGTSSDKDKKAIAAQFLDVARNVILTRSSHERADDQIARDIAPIFKEAGIDVSWIPDLNQAIETAGVDLSENDVIVVAGSLYLAAEARKICFENKG